MTILDASHKLFEFFSENHHFVLEDNFKDVVPISENKELDKAIIQATLDDMEKGEFLKSQESEGIKYYILRRPVEAFEQSVNVNYQTAWYIASVINDFCTAIEDHSDTCDMSNISEKDIKNLALITKHYQEQIDKMVSGEVDSGLGENISFDNIE